MFVFINTVCVHCKTVDLLTPLSIQYSYGIFLKTVFIVLLIIYVCFLDSGTDGESQSSSKEQLSERKMPKPPPIATITYKVTYLIKTKYLVSVLYIF